jgi:hypothetical protein
LLTREQITHAPRPYTQTFSRTKSNKAEEDNERDSKDDRDMKLMAQLKLDLENGDMPLDQRLEDLGIDPVEYKTYVPSKQRPLEQEGKLILDQAVSKPAKSQRAAGRMGTQDKRRGSAEVERTTKHT